MAVNLVMPQLGETITEGTITKWLKHVGDWVGKYEPVVEVNTDKVDVEVPSPEAGYLREILVPEGMTVAVGEVLAVLEEAAVEAKEEAPAEVAASVPAAAPAGARARATPRVRKLARDHGVDLAQVKGSGPGGRITEEDVQAYLAAWRPPRPAPVAPEAIGPEQEVEVVPVTPVRRTIAQRMAQSAFSAPHAWLSMEVDVSSLVRLREGMKDEFRRREGVDLTYVPFVIKAATEALREHPILNAGWSEEGIVLKKRIHIGVAVGADEGLVVPVIRDADQLSIAGLTHAVQKLTDRARAGRLSLDDVQGGTFTVNNTGAFGSVVSMPIINPGQAAIVSMEAIVKKPVVVGDAIAIRHTINLCLSFDHRVLDGAAAGGFLQAMKKRLEAMGPDMSLY
jgi:2-oxoisovalerate dehydrogenase E2 component (dihydrolipoyl transacylase)